MIPPIPSNIKDNLWIGFFQSIRLKLNGRVRLDSYTTLERDGITDWKTADMIFNTDVDTAQVKTNSGWTNL